MRLAWFTPWPPDRHPAARRSRDLVRALAARGHNVDLFVAADATIHPAPPPALLVSAADAERRLARHTPDLIVYHVVRSDAGAFAWPHLAARPGLALLHDVQFYDAFAATAPPPAAREAHARGGSARAGAAFRSEFAWSQPEAGADAAELAIAGFTGAYTALWPMTRLVAERSRAVAVPTRADAEALAARWPDAAVGVVAAGLDLPDNVPAQQTRLTMRAQLGLPDDAVVFAVCLEPDDGPDGRRVPQILRAFATAIGRVPAARLLLCGEVAGVAPELSHGVIRPGPATEGSRWSVMHAADVLVDLHWPRTSGPSDAWLAAAALGRPAILIDSVATADLPLLDPRSWRPADGRAPLGITLDILDEDHSLRQALYRLAIDAGLRARLGQAAQAHWQRHHTMEHMTSDVVAAMERALATADFD